MPCKSCGDTGINPITRDWCACETGRTLAAQADRAGRDEQARALARVPSGDGNVIDPVVTREGGEPS